MAQLLTDSDPYHDALPSWLVRDLRSDHAGETGAVAIYQGILAISKDLGVREFARSHLETEQRHLALIEAILPQRSQSALLVLWRLAGFVTGALPSIFGRNAVFGTIEAVETFVDRHYAEQIDRLGLERAYPEIRVLLEECRADEVHHRDEARQLGKHPPSLSLKCWQHLVSAGSAFAVKIARLI